MHGGGFYVSKPGKKGAGPYHVAADLKGKGEAL